MELPTISVVIPTVDRPTVRAAVLSALNQTYPPFEVIVAVDRSDNHLPDALSDLNDKIRIVFSGGIGPSGARMKACLVASGAIIAFLDDDDEWFPRKLEQQISLWPKRDAGAYTLMSCRYVTTRAVGESQYALPTRLIRPGEKIGSYLFRRSGVRYFEGTMHPSTLVCDRELLILEPWDESLRLHEDWDWILRVGARADVSMQMSPDTLVKVSMADSQSVSRIADWRLSLAWLNERAEKLSPRELGDFLLGHTAVMAAKSGERRHALALARRALLSANPGIYSWLVWALHLLSPALVDRGSKMMSHVKPTTR
jgi:glycosyltransferase involved in cell wall biosynthesis